MEVVEGCVQLLFRDRTNVRALHRLGQAQLSLKRYDAAIETLGKAADVSPTKSILGDVPCFPPKIFVLTVFAAVPSGFSCVM